MKSTLSVEAKHDFGLKKKKLTTADGLKLHGYWKVFDFLILLFPCFGKTRDAV